MVEHFGGFGGGGGFERGGLGKIGGWGFDLEEEEQEEEGNK